VEVVRDFYRDQALLWVAIRPWALALVALTVALTVVKFYKKRLYKKHS
jgi:hypothetical protein